MRVFVMPALKWKCLLMSDLQILKMSLQTIVNYSYNFGTGSKPIREYGEGSA